MAVVSGGFGNSSSIVAGATGTQGMMAKDSGKLIVVEDEVPQLELTVAQLHASLRQERAKNLNLVNYISKIDTFLAYAGLDTHPDLPANKEFADDEDLNISEDWLLPILSSPPVIHSQNQLIESLRSRIKELQDNLHTVYRQVETNQQQYET